MPSNPDRPSLGLQENFYQFINKARKEDWKIQEKVYGIVTVYIYNQVGAKSLLTRCFATVDNQAVLEAEQKMDIVDSTEKQIEAMSTSWKFLSPNEGPLNVIELLANPSTCRFLIGYAPIHSAAFFRGGKYDGTSGEFRNAINGWGYVEFAKPITPLKYNVLSVKKRPDSVGLILPYQESSYEQITLPLRVDPESLAKKVWSPIDNLADNPPLFWQDWLTKLGVQYHHPTKSSKIFP